jgi:hypothetical protein
MCYESSASSFSFIYSTYFFHVSPHLFLTRATLVSSFSSILHFSALSFSLYYKASSSLSHSLARSTLHCLPWVSYLLSIIKQVGQWSLPTSHESGRLLHASWMCTYDCSHARCLFLSFFIIYSSLALCFVCALIHSPCHNRACSALTLSCSRFFLCDVIVNKLYTDQFNMWYLTKKRKNNVQSCVEF